MTLLILMVVGFRNVSAKEAYQTWPSRTPTPKPAATQPPSEPTSLVPTATSTVPSGPGNTRTAEPFPSPTTQQQQVESTNTPVANGTSTEVDSSRDSSQSQVRCDQPPTVEALLELSVYEGPGLNNQIVGQLSKGESRIIISRDANEPWWFIQLNAATRGWVADSDVIVHGNIGSIPILMDDRLNATEDGSWEPTPNPVCLPPEVIPVEEMDESSTLSAASEPSSSTGSTSQGIDQATGEPDRSDEIPAGTIVPPANSDTDEDRIPNSQPNYTWLLVTGIFLILAGSIAFILRRQR